MEEIPRLELSLRFFIRVTNLLREVYDQVDQPYGGVCECVCVCVWGGGYLSLSQFTWDQVIVLQVAIESQAFALKGQDRPDPGQIPRQAPEI